MKSNLDNEFTQPSKLWVKRSNRFGITTENQAITIKCGRFFYFIQLNLLHLEHIGT